MWNLLCLAVAFYRPRTGCRFRRLLGILLIASAWMPLERANAAALTSCTGVNIVLNAAPTVNILVPAQVGSVVYRGTVKVDRTCNIASSINTNNVIVLGANIGKPGGTSTVKGSGSWLGIRLISHAISIAPTGGGCVVNTKTENFGTSHVYLHAHFVGSSAGARCQVLYQYDFEIYVKQLAGAAVVPFPSADPTGTSTLNGTAGWLVWEDNGTTTGHGLPNVSVNFTPVGCTVSTNNIVVNLAAARSSDLNAPGKTSQTQAFNIVLTGCLGLATPYAAVANWSFTQLGGNSTVVSNSAASGAASNVGIQLLDGNANPISSNGTSTLMSIPASGSYSATHYARYYAVGAATGGNVQGVATFNVTYQ